MMPKGSSNESIYFIYGSRIIITLNLDFQFNNCGFPFFSIHPSIDRRMVRLLSYESRPKEKEEKSAMIENGSGSEGKRKRANGKIIVK